MNIRLMRLKPLTKAAQRVATALERLVEIEESRQPYQSRPPRHVVIDTPSYDEWNKNYADQQDRELTGTGEIDIKS